MPASRRADAALGEKADTGPSSSSEPRPESIRLLMEWAKAVCAFYGAKVAPSRLCVSPRVFKRVSGRVTKKVSLGSTAISLSASLPSPLAPTR